jgi:hypothetical protein
MMYSAFCSLVATLVPLDELLILMPSTVGLVLMHNLLLHLNPSPEKLSILSWRLYNRALTSSMTWRAIALRLWTRLRMCSSRRCASVSVCRKLHQDPRINSDFPHFFRRLYAPVFNHMNTVLIPCRVAALVSAKTLEFLLSILIHHFLFMPNYCPPHSF